LAGLFLNIKGRYSQGTVDPGDEADRLREEIAERLANLVDPESGTSAVRRIYRSANVYRGPYKDAAPDLVVGYQRGYRAAWETAVGQTTEHVFHANRKDWSGYHCIDPSLVPGVLFCNRPVETETPRLLDIGPTVLELFGAAVPQYMDGRPLRLLDKPEENPSSPRGRSEGGVKCLNHLREELVAERG
jgi:predicted AlkP superfamily phosphohydrolase/phosphomutase